MSKQVQRYNKQEKTDFCDFCYKWITLLESHFLCLPSDPRLFVTLCFECYQKIHTSNGKE
jgi:hypothetical protein